MNTTNNLKTKKKRDYHMYIIRLGYNGKKLVEAEIIFSSADEDVKSVVLWDTEFPVCFSFIFDEKEKLIECVTSINKEKKTVYILKKRE